MWPILKIDSKNTATAAMFAPKPLAMVGADGWTVQLISRGYPEFKHNDTHITQTQMKSVRIILAGRDDDDVASELLVPYQLLDFVTTADADFSTGSLRAITSVNVPFSFPVKIIWWNFRADH
ncbi:hypothetical protein [Rubinisphaera italica]|uniref:hypothetical protein n=1 Tax=Rubinisphaera italica TaxID=2527969 RepID=UPI0011B72CDE|nr:hypothetical protein [Rubinisphaera italica]